MENKMLTKSIRLTKEDSIGLADIVANDPRVERGPSEALRICFEDAAACTPDWNTVKKRAEKLEYPEDITLEGNDTKTFLVSEEVFTKVFNSINEQLGSTRPRASFITRLCIFNTRLKLYAQSEEKSVTSVEKNIIDKDKLLGNFKDLSTDEKLIEIYKLLLERGI